MKTTEELNALKAEVEALNGKLAELTDEELAQVIGGETDEDVENPCPRRYNHANPSCLDFLGRIEYDCPYAKGVGRGTYKCQKGKGQFICARNFMPDV